jgi:hypothetical protein
LSGRVILVYSYWPKVRFAAPGSTEEQIKAISFSAQVRLVRQQTEPFNGLRACLYEYSNVVSQLFNHIRRIG